MLAARGLSDNRKPLCIALLHNLHNPLLHQWGNWQGVKHMYRTRVFLVLLWLFWNPVSEFSTLRPKTHQHTLAFVYFSSLKLIDYILIYVQLCGIEYEESKSAKCLKKFPSLLSVKLINYICVHKFW